MTLSISIGIELSVFRHISQPDRIWITEQKHARSETEEQIQPGSLSDLTLLALAVEKPLVSSFLPSFTRRPFLRLTVALRGRGPVWLHPPSLPLYLSFALSTDPEWISTRSSLMSLCRSTLAKSVQHGSPGDRMRGEMCLSILSSILYFLFCFSQFFLLGL